MALKNLFDMVKADRYTQDGREELIKAQEEETEDKVYQIGEISQKTGLQKTANGWVKPKSGKQPGAKKEEYNPSRRVDPKKQPQVSNPNVLGMTANGAKKRFEALGGEFLENKDGVDIFKTRDGDLVKVHYDDNKKVLRTETTPAESKPALSQTDGKGNKVEIKITESKGGGFYVDKYVNGKKIGIDNANTRESAEAKAKSMMEQHMADPDYRAESKPATKLPAKPTRGMSESYIRGTQLMKPAEDESQRGEQHWAGVLSGYDNTSVIEQRKQLQEKYDEFEEDIKDYDRRGLAPAVYAKRINQQNFIKGALKAIDEEMENRGMDPAPRTSVPDAAPRVLTGDTKIRVRKA